MAQIILIEPTPVPPPLTFTYRSYPPLALLTLAAPLVEAGYQVKIIDQRVESQWEKTLLESIDGETLCVGITSITGRQLLYALEAAKVVKENTSVPVVFGGVHASLLPEQTVGHQWIDFVVQGEGEETFLELIRALGSNQRAFAINGLWYKESGKIHGNPPRAFLDMNSLPRIPFELVDFKEYDLDEVLPLCTSRGCSHRCGFCYNISYCSRVWRSMSVRRVLDDLTYFTKRYSPKKIIFRDDNFFQDLNRAMQICEGIVQEGFNFRWSASCRIDTIRRMSDGDLLLLKQSGFEGFAFGIESGAPRMLEVIQKDITVEDITFAASRLRERGMMYSGSFMGGYPGETEDDLDETIELVSTLFTQDPTFAFEMFLFIPYPGTTAQDTLASHGFQVPQKTEDWANFQLAYDSTMTSVGKPHSLYAEPTPWLSDNHKQKLFHLEALGQVAGRPVFRSTSLMAQLCAIPYNMLIYIARYRWRCRLLGPVPEVAIINFIRKIGLKLYVKIKGELPYRS